MKTRLNFSLSLILAGGFTLTAVGNEQAEGIKCYKCNLVEQAKILLLNELEQENTDKAEVCYYLGELYYDLQKPDSASFYYKKGISLNSEYPFNLVGEGKLLLKTNAVSADKLFSEALSGKNRKNVCLQLALADAYKDVNPEKSTEWFEKAKSTDSKCADVYVYEGDRLLAKNNTGQACSRYEEAIYFDPSCTEAYVKYARVYAHTNFNSAIEMLKNLESKEPASMIAPRIMAEIYYENSRFGDAAQAYEKFINSVGATDKELSRYATVLFYHNDFARSIQVANKVLQHDPDNTVMKRIAIYDMYELKEYGKGIAAAETFFRTVKPEDVIGQDFLYYGRLLMKEKKLELAIHQLEKMLTLDTTKTDVYKELAAAYEKLNNYGKAAVYYDDFIKKGGENVKVVDYFMSGKCHYFAGNALDSLAGKDERAAHFVLADSIFGYVAEKVPDNYLGNFWRARTNSSMDPETEKGLAKPYYEAAMKLLADDAKNVRLLIECYSYLGYYYYVKNDLALSKEYWNNILKLEPENEIAKKALEGMK